MAIIIRLIVFTALLAAGTLMTVSAANGAEANILAEITDNERCPVCGMLVAKYPTWVTQISLSDGRVVMFDGPKDMLAYFHSPDEFGAGTATVEDVVVRDYYTQQWIDGRAAYYVIGSDVYGPMGSEFIPFETRDGAETFIKDHHGKRILSFNEVDEELVQNMRKGHKMK